MKAKLIAVSLAFCALSSVADVKYFCVPPGTSGVPENPDYLSWETAGTNIYDAVYAANGSHKGDSTQRTLYVMSGTYVITNQIEINNAQFEMRSSKGPAAQEEIDPEGTTLCGGYPATTNRIVHINSDSLNWDKFCVFRGFTVTNGWVEGKGGGIYVQGARHDSTCVADCRIVGNLSYRGAGGGIAFEPDTSGAGYITNCIVVGNVTTNLWVKGQDNGTTGGAVSIGSTGGAAMSSPSRTAGFRVLDTVISNNVSCGNAIRSCGLWVRQNSAWIENCTIADNRGLAMSDGNAAYSEAAYLMAGSMMVNCLVSENCVQNSSGASGVHAMAACVVSNCVFRGNSGATTFLADGYESKYQNIPVSLVNCIFNGNGGDGSVLVQTGNGMVMRNCLLMNATGSSFTMGSRTAALKCESDNVSVENCTIANNAKGIFCLGSKVLPVVNCAVYGSTIRDLHQTGDGGGGVSFTNCYFSSSAPRLADDIKSRPNVDCVFSDAPLFTDAANGDFSLQLKSPLCDAGVALAWMKGACDVAGKPRCLDSAGNATDSALPDIGCYECALGKMGLSIILR
ncbi:MAG: right-handed parallel beta-helix repeat-containing protein [Kiritimatiellae bacterium]|nr:right-handed parallel beta-helix repeat-containing protein [Kiritimatiellia bacterium]